MPGGCQRHLVNPTIGRVICPHQHVKIILIQPELHPLDVGGIGIGCPKLVHFLAGVAPLISNLRIWDVNINAQRLQCLPWAGCQNPARIGGIAAETIGLVRLQSGNHHLVVFNKGGIGNMAAAAPIRPGVHQDGIRRAIGLPCGSKTILGNICDGKITDDQRTGITYPGFLQAVVIAIQVIHVGYQADFHLHGWLSSRAGWLLQIGVVQFTRQNSRGVSNHICISIINIQFHFQIGFIGTQPVVANADPEVLVSLIHPELGDRQVRLGLIFRQGYQVVIGIPESQCGTAGGIHFQVQVHSKHIPIRVHIHRPGAAVPVDHLEILAGRLVIPNHRSPDGVQPNSSVLVAFPADHLLPVPSRVRMNGIHQVGILDGIAEVLISIFIQDKRSVVTCAISALRLVHNFNNPIRAVIHCGVEFIAFPQACPNTIGKVGMVILIQLHRNVTECIRADRGGFHRGEDKGIAHPCGNRQAGLCRIIKRNHWNAPIG